MGNAPRSRWALAWGGLTAAFALQVLDEATHDFLAWYNPTALAIRERLGGVPFPPVFSSAPWLAGLCAAVVLLAALTPLIRPGCRDGLSSRRWSLASCTSRTRSRTWSSRCAGGGWHRACSPRRCCWSLRPGCSTRPRVSRTPTPNVPLRYIGPVASAAIPSGIWHGWLRRRAMWPMLRSEHSPLPRARTGSLMARDRVMPGVH